jgi:hypothetical protein
MATSYHDYITQQDAKNEDNYAAFTFKGEGAQFHLFLALNVLT